MNCLDVGNIDKYSCLSHGIVIPKYKDIDETQEKSNDAILLDLSDNSNESTPNKAKLNVLKRQIVSDDLPVLQKVPKLFDEDPKISKNISTILTCSKRSLNCFLKCEAGILFGGTRGLLQLREGKVIDI